jgi:hypothetical protein
VTVVLDKPVESERSEKIRLSLDMTPAMKEVIDDLAAREGITRAELLRRAIALLKTVKDAQQKGESPALIDGEGHVTARIVGI